MKRVAILGSTGSIGVQALDVIARHPDQFEVVGLAAGSNAALFAEQVATFSPIVASLADDAARERASAALHARAAIEPRWSVGAEGLRSVATESAAEIVLAATDGAVAFDAVFAAVDLGIDVAVANKELVVAAGELLFAAARASGSRIMPVDSEHSAIFQCLVGESAQSVERIVLTASGGPFWESDAHAIAQATLGDALRHPTWQMGPKNTIDSATLMNKGLEVIEAARFFNLPGDRIDVLIHRTSLAHGFVVFCDGSVKSQIAPPDMRLPIGYALSFPERLLEPEAAAAGSAALIGATLRFERPDDRFPCLQLAYHALAMGGTAPAVLSAANEVAVAAFVYGSIRFGDIATVVEESLSKTEPGELSLTGVRDADNRARRVARSIVERNASIAKKVETI